MSPNTTQLLLVTTADWNASTGILHTFSRKQNQTWQEVGDGLPVNVGRSGSAWGRGLHPVQTNSPQKIEGDGRAPAGVFAIGKAFGYSNALDTRLSYQAMTAQDWCVDVNASPWYNQLVNTQIVGELAIVGASEPMRRDLHVEGDQRYRAGFVIAHNPDNVPGGGSCIFAHLWKASNVATAGCTAMADTDMMRLLAWLDSERSPVFILLPKSEYTRLQFDWQLPVLTP